jgi:hypothetical protein
MRKSILPLVFLAALAQAITYPAFFVIKKNTAGSPADLAWTDTVKLSTAADSARVSDTANYCRHCSGGVSSVTGGAGITVAPTTGAVIVTASVTPAVLADTATAIRAAIAASGIDSATASALAAIQVHDSLSVFVPDSTRAAHIADTAKRAGWAKVADSSRIAYASVSDTNFLRYRKDSSYATWQRSFARSLELYWDSSSVESFTAFRPNEIWMRHRDGGPFVRIIANTYSYEYGRKVRITGSLFGDVDSSCGLEVNGPITGAYFSGNLSGTSDSAKRSRYADSASASNIAATATKLATARTIATSGDATGTATSFDGSANISIPVTVTKINGTALSGLATGILKNTTSTGVPSIAVAGTDYLAPTGGATVTTLGTITSGTWTGTTIAAANGGTGQTSYTIGDILYASTTTALSKLADVATGKVLISGGVGVAPSWGQAVLTSAVTGVLPVANGGTNISAPGATAGNLRWNGSAYAIDTTAYLTSSTGVTSITGTANQVIASASVGAVTLSLPQSIATTSSPTFAGGTFTGALSGTSATFSGDVVGNTWMHCAAYGVLTGNSETVNGSPWYGLGVSNISGYGGLGNYVQLGSYFGLRFQVANYAMVFNDGGLTVPVNISGTSATFSSTLTVTGATTHSAGVKFASVDQSSAITIGVATPQLIHVTASLTITLPTASSTYAGLTYYVIGGTSYTKTFSFTATNVFSSTALGTWSQSGQGVTTLAFTNRFIIVTCDGSSWNIAAW